MNQTLGQGVQFARASLVTRLFLLCVLIVISLGAALAQNYTVSDLVGDLEARRVARISVDGNGNANVEYKAKNNLPARTTVIPTTPQFLQQIRDAGVDLTVRQADRGGTLRLITQILPLIMSKCNGQSCTKRFPSQPIVTTW